MLRFFPESCSPVPTENEQDQEIENENHKTNQLPCPFADCPRRNALGS